MFYLSQLSCMISVVSFMYLSQLYLVWSQLCLLCVYAIVLLYAGVFRNLGTKVQKYLQYAKFLLVF